MDLVSFLSTLPWWVPIVCVPGVNVIIFFLAKWMYKIFYPKIENHSGTVLSTILRVFYRPLQTLLWVIGFSIMVSLYADHLFDVSYTSIVKILIKVAIVFCFAWTAYLFSREIERIVLSKKQYDTTTIELASKLSLIGIGFITLLLILPLFGVHIAGLLAFGGFGGIAIGLAAKDALANVFGGIIMALDKPFKLGDWIYTTDASMEGIVEHIGWRMTIVRQFDKRPLYIPNQSFSNMTFINGSRMTNRRIEKVIGIRYCDAGKLISILEEIRDYLKGRPDLDHSLTNYVHFINFGPSSLEFKMRAYTKTIVFIEWLRISEEILVSIHAIIEKQGAQIAFPTTTIDFPHFKEPVSPLANSELHPSH